MKTEIVVAHLSDLHHPSIKEDRWEQLKTYLKASQPDLILVTGDLTNHPWPWRQFQVRKKLENLVQTCRDARTAADVRLSVIPGNHDSAFWGNVGCSVLRALSFNLLFGKYYEPFFEIPLGNNKAYFFSFNSNPFVAHWANGKVSQRQLKLFQRKIDELRRANRDSFAHAYKVVLLHHHPMPIPYDEELEKYLFLKNAGEFINVMAQNGVNIILHGHKHKARVSYLSLGTSSAARNIGIVACGTTLKSNEENSCYLIRIFDNTRAEVRRVSAAADADSFTEESAVYSIPKWDTYIQDRYEAVKDKLGYEIGNVAYKVIVDKDGDGHTEVQLDDIVITNPIEFKKVAPFEQKVGAGTISHFQYHASGATASKLQVDEPSNRERRLKLNLSPIDDGSYSFGFDDWTLNSWALDTEQWDRKYKHTEDRPRYSERFYFSFVRPIQQFRAEVQLPKNCTVAGAPELIVQALIQDEAGNDRLSKPVKGIEQYLNTSLTFSPERNVILLALDKPLYGYTYTIRWYVSAPSQSQANDQYVDETQALIQALWERRNLREFAASLKTVERMIRQGFNFNENEIIDVTLAIPIPEAQPSAALEFIASNLEFHPILKERLAIGDGTQGRAFKTNAIEYYNAARVSNHDPKSNIYMSVGGYTHRILYAFPIVHPMATQQIIGVLSIGSQNRLSGLLPREGEERDKVRHMADIVYGYFLPSLEQKCNMTLSRPGS